MATLNWSALTSQEQKLVVIGIQYALKEFRSVGLVEQGTRYPKDAAEQVLDAMAKETHRLHHRNLAMKRKLIKARQQGFSG